MKKQNILWRITGRKIRTQAIINRTIYIVAATREEAVKKAKQHLSPRVYQDLEFSSNMAEEIESGVFIQPMK